MKLTNQKELERVRMETKTYTTALVFIALGLGLLVIGWFAYVFLKPLFLFLSAASNHG